MKWAIWLLPVFLVTSCLTKTKQMNADSDIRSDDTLKLLFIGTYTEKEAHVNGKAAGIYICRLNTKTGRLTQIGVSPATINPSYLGMNPQGSILYCVNETGSNNPDASGSLSAFKLNYEDTSLTFMNQISSHGNYPCYVEVDPSGKYVMVANYGSGTVALLSVKTDGSLDSAVSVDQHTGKGLTSRQEAPHAHMITVSPNGRFAYSCDLGTNQIYIYRLSTEKGRLEPTGHSYTAQPGSGPRHMAFHPVKNRAYVVNELSGTIECMETDTSTGTLRHLQTITTLKNEDDQNAACADIHITPSGKFLYASNRGTHNNLAFYAIDTLSGKLTLLGHHSVQGTTPRSFVIDPTGTFLLVANQDSDNVVCFRIDPETGKLIDTGIELHIPTPVCLKFLPDRLISDDYDQTAKE